MDLGLNLAAVAVATAAYMAIGALWYSPLLLGSTWLRAMGKPQEDLGRVDLGYALSAVGAATIAVAIAYLLSLAPGGGMISGARLALLAWAGFVVPTQAVSTFFEGRSWTLCFIYAGYQFFAFGVMGAILGAWR
jgi:hypothetical protein